MADCTALDAVRCPCGHGPMVQRPTAGQTPEQLFCGVWWDCPKCHSSALYQSAELRAQLAERQAQPALDFAARVLGRKGGTANSPAQQAQRSQPKPGAGRPRRYVYEAIAQHGGKDAGFVCYGWTKDECQEKAAKRTGMTVAIRRTPITPEAIESLRAVGKL